jgi:hypothetical protein
MSSLSDVNGSMPPTLDVIGAEFAKTTDCIDLLSFDPGTVNLAVTHLRVDKRQYRFCILHAALIDISQPRDCFAYPQPMNGRARKPERVEPYTCRYPQPLVHGVDKPVLPLSAAHNTVLCNPEPPVLSAMPWALNCVPWIANVDALDYVLIEAQDPNSAAMRAVQHSIQAYFETRNAVRGATAPLIQFVNARLKLSDALVGTLGTHMRFLDDGRVDESLVNDDAQGNGNADILALLDRANHDANKRSTNRLWDWLRRERDFGTQEHRFLAWMERQRAERHNILDSLLQAFAFCLDNGIGCADEHRLDHVRKERQSALAKERRRQKKRQKTATTATDDAATTEETGIDDASECNSNAVVQILPTQNDYDQVAIIARE